MSDRIDETHDRKLIDEAKERERLENDEPYPVKFAEMDRLSAEAGSLSDPEINPEHCLDSWQGPNDGLLHLDYWGQEKISGGFESALGDRAGGQLAQWLGLEQEKPHPQYEVTDVPVDVPVENSEEAQKEAQKKVCDMLSNEQTDTGEPRDPFHVTPWLMGGREKGAIGMSRDCPNPKHDNETDGSTREHIQVHLGEYDYEKDGQQYFKVRIEAEQH